MDRRCVSTDMLGDENGVLSAQEHSDDLLDRLFVNGGRPCDPIGSVLFRQGDFIQHRFKRYAEKHWSRGRFQGNLYSPLHALDEDRR